jgi:hypothetical protein
MVVAPELLSGLNAEKLRELVTDLIAQVARNDQTISARNVQINALDQQIVSLDLSSSVQNFPRNSVQIFPGDQSNLTDFFLCLKRNESLPVSRISQ